MALTALAVVVFVFYHSILPNVQDSVATPVNDWMPISAINNSMIWVIMALGLNIVVGYAGLLDLGYVAFWAIGGYTAAWLMSTFAGDEWSLTLHIGSPSVTDKATGIHISFWLVLIIAAAFCALWGIIIGTPTLRLRSDYLAIVTLGFGEIIPQFFRNAEDIGGINISNGDKGIGPVDAIGTGPFSHIQGVKPALGAFDLDIKFVVYAILVAVCVLISLRIREGRLGRAWLAIREDELAAGMMGIPLVKAKLSAYAVGAAFGGLGGVAYATLVGTTFPTFSFAYSITILLMVVLGGMGNVWGVIVGALALSWINSTGLAQFGDTFNSQFGTNIDFPGYNYLIFGVILVLMMLFRREGLIPERRTQRILREPSRTELEAVGSDVEAGQSTVKAESGIVVEPVEPGDQVEFAGDKGRQL
ncbi:MAG: branched-chain amino acid ABC transporter permease [Actinomycetota bacterium]